MGTWGPAIFSNDTAPDGREDFRDLVAKGATPAEATEKILAEYGVGILGDPDNNDLWLGLAATQHKTGHIVPEVIDRALAIAESPQELERWAPGDRKGRLRALTRLRETLRTAPPPPRKLRPRPVATTALEIGQHQLFSHIESGSQFLLRVVGFHEDQGGRSAVYTLLAWDGSDDGLRHPQDLLPLRRRPAAHRYAPQVHCFGLMLCAPRPRKEHLRDLEPRFSGEGLPIRERGLLVTAWASLPKVVIDCAVSVPRTVHETNT
ncbi:hypothetical protein J2X01_002446 [Arthrobacter ginsengisoli]|uniref:DUF4259 domain-containing protein n=1 Tax=Arthrobacter ginsengisoli TaxID=1356565 RepID=A0ABU1UDC9_9MICC|nr:hypothetical protein [Arthrobacter ginsengisoli]MDR7083153.1 hypothetical protein [Arthrobacter ginsengisoli]